MTTIQTYAVPVSGGFVGVLAARLGHRFAALRDRWTTADDLSQFSDRALADIGLRRDDIPGAVDRTMRDQAPRFSFAL